MNLIQEQMGCCVDLADEENLFDTLDSDKSGTIKDTIE